MTRVERGELILLACCVPLPVLAGLPYGSELDLRALSWSSARFLLSVLESVDAVGLTLPPSRFLVEVAGRAREECGAELLHCRLGPYLQ